MDWRKKAEKILHLTLEITRLLTGEDCAVVKKTSAEWSEPKNSSRRETRRFITVSSMDILRLDQMTKKILEVLQKMMKMLTGEVPIRCQDVTVYFSMEEWEYLEGHKDLYKDVMMEVELDGSRKRNPPQRSPLPRDSSHLTTPRHDQVDGTKCLEGHKDAIMEKKALKNMKLEEKKNHFHDTMLSLSLEIIDLLTGEEHKVEKKISGDQMTLSGCPDWSFKRRSEMRNKQRLRTTNLSCESASITRPPALCLSPEKHYVEVLNVTKKIVEMLTNEVPIRCQDVAVYFSMGEWEYLEGHKDLYKDVMMEDHQMSTLLADGSNVLNPSKGHGMISLDSSAEDSIEYSVNVHDNLSHASAPSYDSLNVCDGLRHRPEAPPNPDEMSDNSDTRPDSHGGTDLSNSASRTIGNKAKKIFRCSECDKCYTTKGHLTRHQTLHTGVRPYLCSECGKCFREKERLIQHFKVHTGERPFSCPECGKRYKQRAHLKSHLITHSGEKPYSCSECGKCFIRKDSLTSHQRYHIGEMRHSCTECGRGFIRRGLLIKHQRTHTGERPFLCTACGKSFKQKFCLEQHWKAHRNECFACKMQFNTKEELQEHRRVHSAKVFLCSECDRSFTNKSLLVLHQRVHTGEKPFSCSECGKCFAEKGALGRHFKVHTGEKPFSCPECGKSFSEKSFLCNHLKVHISGKPFGCSECGKRFNLKANLVIHQRIHTGEKPYSCCQCQKSFVSKSHLRNHRCARSR